MLIGRVSSCTPDTTQNRLKLSVSCIMTTGSVVFLKSNTAEWTVLLSLSSQCSQFTACLPREKTSQKHNFKTFSERVHLQRTLCGLQRKMKLSLVLVCHVFQHLFLPDFRCFSAFKCRLRPQSRLQWADSTKLQKSTLSRSKHSLTFWEG